MKVRIAGNSIRFRLKRPEVKLFSEKGIIEEVIEFGDGDGERICFSLQRTPADQLAIEYAKGNVTIFIPEPLAVQWTQSEQVGFDERLKTKQGRMVSILVEKDFACLDATESENIGTYPNPLTICKPVK
jgi:hypothetical protein